MKNLRTVFLMLLLTLLCATPAAADVIWGPAMAVFLAIHYWYVTLLVIAVVIVTIIMIIKIKKKGE